MNDFISVLTPGEAAALSLRLLYDKAGFSLYKMSKFEEYDLYARNKDFLVSENVITFTDTDGRLLALKPDVTLSIIKSKSNDGESKVFYDERVYRLDRRSHSFREVMQVGLEWLGEIGINEAAQVINLAVRSLKTISSSFVLEVSHLGVTEAALSAAKISEKGKSEYLNYLAAKNAFAVKSLCERENIRGKEATLLNTLVTVQGKPSAVIPKIKSIGVRAADDALDKLEKVLSLAESDSVIIDFSVVNDMKYYSGLAFKGFVEGLPSGVLSGGQYDNLMRRMDKKGSAIGFAVYLDEVDRLGRTGGKDENA